MESIHVAAGGSYTVSLGPGLLNRIGELLLPSLKPCHVAIVTDNRVGQLYAGTVKESLIQAGYAVSIFTFPAGERSKDMRTLSEILEFLASEQLTRTDCVIALGGGVVGDLAGFAAGCYLRGIRYVQVPTTLLAAVDSSVGGKTGLNLATGKNLVGLFWQPSAVICALDCLYTLPEEVFLDGVVEAIKTGILGDEELFSLFEQGSYQKSIETVIARCISFKARIVEEDEHEGHLRKILNLGHTIGHAIEVCSNYTITHGYAVAAGIAMITRTAVALGNCPVEEARRIVGLFTSLGLPVETGYPTALLVEAALHDKKREGDRITLVLPERIGSCLLREYAVGELGFLIEKGRGEVL